MDELPRTVRICPGGQEERTELDAAAEECKMPRGKGHRHLKPQGSGQVL